MEIYESLFSTGFVLNEQIAREIFEILPEQGPVMIIMDRDGNSWPSDSAQFAKLNINESFLKRLCATIDDGAEPVVTGVNDCSVIGTQLATDQSNCGYVIIALPKYSPESTLVNIDLIEILLNLTCLIAKLIEKNKLLQEVQMKHYRIYSKSEIATN
jgi:hypothetical protein